MGDANNTENTSGAGRRSTDNKEFETRITSTKSNRWGGILNGIGLAFLLGVAVTAGGFLKQVDSNVKEIEVAKQERKELMLQNNALLITLAEFNVQQRESDKRFEEKFDDSNKKDGEWYINTNQSYAFADNKVTATYGTATARAHADTTWTQKQIDDGDAPDDADTDTVATRGLKYNLIQTLKQQVAGELSKTDWYITRNTEKSTAIPSAITTHRDLVRTRQATMETQITNASDTPALETLYTYVNTGTEENPVMERPLGELPEVS